jgi:hypothetical protein
VAEREILALSQEMTISREDFLRLLPGAVEDAHFRVDGDQIRPVDAERHWRIVLSLLDDLRLGAIRLPRHRVEIHLTGDDADEHHRFVARFELHYRRAGG